MKKYIEPVLEIEEVIIEDVIAASTYTQKTFGDILGSSDASVNW